MRVSRSDGLSMRFFIKQTYDINEQYEFIHHGIAIQGISLLFQEQKKRKGRLRRAVDRHRASPPILAN